MSKNLLDQTITSLPKPHSDKILHNLQANILKPHGRNHSWHIFMQFIPEEIGPVKEWIGYSLAGPFRLITSAYEQISQAEKRATDKSFDGGLVACFFLSLAGYRELKLVSDDTTTLPSTFVSMKEQVSKLRDPEVIKWEFPFQQEIHAMLLIADNKKKRLRKMLKEIRSATNKFARIVTIERGKILRDKEGRPIEHFGYTDGISQPVLSPSNKRKDQIELSPLEIVLTKDPISPMDDCFGSYLVFRKIEQNVKEFDIRRKEIVKKLCQHIPENQRHSLAGAFTIGRFENGTPVTKFPSEHCGAFNDNNFDYQDDKEGSKCPFHAHIRLTNPRGDLREGRRARIVRRGVTYDEIGRSKYLDDFPSCGVGLLFMCYQADIGKQFETIQHWANMGDFLNKPRGVDGIIGQGLPRGTKQAWPVEWEGKTFCEDLLRDVTTLKGGEYFFAPSIPFLQNL